MMSDDDRAKVVKCLVDFIDKVTKKERPSKAEVEVLPEVVRALREFITFYLQKCNTNLRNYKNIF